MTCCVGSVGSLGSLDSKWRAGRIATGVIAANTAEHLVGEVGGMVVRKVGAIRMMVFWKHHFVLVAA